MGGLSEPPPSAMFFKEFDPIRIEESGLASPGGFEPPLPP